MKPTVVYIHVPNDVEHERYALRFVESVIVHDPGVPHSTLVVCQGAMPNESMSELFSLLPDVSYLVHGDSGWDIGGFIAAAKHLSKSGDAPMMCMGGNSSVRRQGWLKRMMEVWEKSGPGLYGTLSSFQVRPHLNTTGFMCPPSFLLRYPVAVVTKEDRYEFEHGRRAFWKLMSDAGEIVKLVTWDGEWWWPQWRYPGNISCKGDQSNCITVFRVNYNYDHYREHDHGAMINLMILTDVLTDPDSSQPETFNY